jgi:hypothetical protein
VKKATETQRLTISLPADLHAKLCVLTVRDRTSASKIIKEYLVRYIEKAERDPAAKKWLEDGIKLRMASVERGAQ